MPPRLTPVSATEVIRVLERLGFVKARQRGSHVVMKRYIPSGEVVCVVSIHRKPIPIGTLQSILKQAHLTPEEFLENL
jgi:predicted RNA binding protein YcfA (HicA-like mRNA interferase family)